MSIFCEDSSSARPAAMALVVVVGGGDARFPRQAATKINAKETHLFPNVGKYTNLPYTTYLLPTKLWETNEKIYIEKIYYYGRYRKKSERGGFQTLWRNPSALKIGDPCLQVDVWGAQYTHWNRKWGK